MLVIDYNLLNRLIWSQGGCAELFVEVGDRKDILLEEGDVVLFPKGTSHRLYSRQEQEAPMPPVQSADTRALPLLYNGGSGPETGILCGQFEFSHGAANALLEALPELVHVRTRDRADLAMLHELVEMLRLEAEGVRPGGRIVISQLASALFALLMRAWLEQSASMPGLLALLTQPRLQSAVLAILASPERP